jgi:hypothetical protein
MRAEDRVLNLARQVWQQDAAPSENAVRLAVDRAARRLRLRKQSAVAPRVWAWSGTFAVLVATLAYAGRGRLLHPSGDTVALRPAILDLNAAPGSLRVSATPGSSRTAHDVFSASGESAPRAGMPATQTAGSALEATAIDIGELGVDSAGAGTLSPLGAPARASGSSAALLSTSRTAADSASRSAGSQRIGKWPEASSRSRGTRTEGAARRIGTARGGAARLPSWSDVNEALAARDRGRASDLLKRLAERSPDADTRAKALLGIAQMEAGAGNCERGRRLALDVAARPGIEIKTVRRALELASRCAK